MEFLPATLAWCYKKCPWLQFFWYHSQCCPLSVQPLKYGSRKRSLIGTVLSAIYITDSIYVWVNMCHKMSISDRKMEPSNQLGCASERVDVAQNVSKYDEMCPPSWSVTACGSKWLKICVTAELWKWVCAVSENVAGDAKEDVQGSSSACAMCKWKVVWVSESMWCNWVSDRVCQGNQRSLSLLFALKLYLCIYVCLYLCICIFVYSWINVCPESGAREQAIGEAARETSALLLLCHRFVFLH